MQHAQRESEQKSENFFPEKFKPKSPVSIDIHIRLIKKTRHLIFDREEFVSRQKSPLNPTMHIIKRICIICMHNSHPFISTPCNGTNIPNPTQEIAVAFLETQCVTIHTHSSNGFINTHELCYCMNSVTYRT